ncbi:enoyl-CoA hydratase/isomerase family protein [Halobacillus litoralis]|uniref:enoyl-CoA hydratase/isomerase family protein n=1 Tax=Halobacillus litoralis TaxID=45668 RepID=UPI001CD4680C|nr:enoyl-CoA hydratase/isomerase family protein [Halobacillus litoralis]MCA0969382.1 enoyl-CoA hydratase/isomerase family protein [Halobacillus litoralis]
MRLIRLDYKDEGYAVMTLNRPDKMNAINHEMINGLKSALEEIRAKEGVTFVVLTGAGDRAFCAGGDLKEFHGDLEAQEAYALLSPMKDVLYKLATLPIPTIALLNGQARGGGCELATACDFRYARQGTSFGFVQGNLGIAPGWGGGALLYERIKRDMAAHWLLTSEMLTADEVKEFGWLHKVCTEEEWQSGQLLTPLLNKTPAQTKWFKRQLLSSLRLDELSVRMEEETAHTSVLWESEEHKEAVQKFLISRKN